MWLEFWARLIFLDWKSKTYGQTKYSFKEFYTCLFRLDKQGKQTNKTCGQTNRLDTQDKPTHKTYSQTIYSFEELCACLFRLYTQDKRQSRHMAKQHIHQKEFRLPFLDWTNRTNIHTSHKAKENIRSKNSMLVFLDWKHKINGQTRHMAKQHIHQKDSRFPF